MTACPSATSPEVISVKDPSLIPVVTITRFGLSFSSIQIAYCLGADWVTPFPVRGRIRIVLLRAEGRASALSDGPEGLMPSLSSRLEARSV